MSNFRIKNLYTQETTITDTNKSRVIDHNFEELYTYMYKKRINVWFFFVGLIMIATPRET